MCRKILSNYNSTAFFASVFRQEFSPRFFDSKFRQHLTNFYGNRQIFCRLLSNFVENYCRKILSKLDNIFLQDFSPANYGIRHFSQAFDKIFVEWQRKLSANVVENCCRIFRQHCSTKFAKKLGQSSLKIVELWRSFASTEFDKRSLKKLKKKYPHRGGYFL